jgi:hypothetical protein
MNSDGQVAGLAGVDNALELNAERGASLVGRFRLGIENAHDLGGASDMKAFLSAAIVVAAAAVGAWAVLNKDAKSAAEAFSSPASVRLDAKGHS